MLAEPNFAWPSLDEQSRHCNPRRGWRPRCRGRRVLVRHAEVGHAAAGDRRRSGYRAGRGKGGSGGQADRPRLPSKPSRSSTAPIPQVITTVGSLRSDESITLRPESAGRISAITFQEGQRVAKGAPLVTLDPAMPRAELEQAKANLRPGEDRSSIAPSISRSATSSRARRRTKPRTTSRSRRRPCSWPRPSSRRPISARRSPASSACARCRSATTSRKARTSSTSKSIDPLKVDFRVPETYLRQVQVGQSLRDRARRDARQDVRGQGASR